LNENPTYTQTIYGKFIQAKIKPRSFLLGF